MLYTREDLNEDGACRIDNPLRDLNPDQLRQQADEFAKLVSKEPRDGSWVRWFKTLAYWAHLSRRPVVGQEQDDPEEPDRDLIVLFRKAAEVAQNPLKLDRMTLSNHEKKLLQHEHELRFWDQPKALRVTVVTLCFSAIVQGWIQSCSNGANQNWPTELHIIDQNGSWNPAVHNAQWIFAAVNAITFLAASFFGCWLSDPLQSMILGRRGAIFVSGLLCFAALIGSACTHSWQQLMICRALVGFGMGAKASVTPIFGAESSPSHLRGALVMNWQLFDALGIFLGFTANLIFAHAGSNLSWRLQYASACVPTACLMTLVWTIPESPRWLLKQRRHRGAFRSLCCLRETRLQAAIELFYANAQLQIEAEMQPGARHDAEKSLNKSSSQHIENSETLKELSRFQDSAAMTSYFSRLVQLFRDARTRRATVAASVVMISQQLCGINILQFYGSTFFRDIGGPGPSTTSQQQPTEGAIRALWLSWGVGLANFVFTFPAYYLIDRKGRRFLLFWTYPGMILSMLAACLCFVDTPSSDSPSPYSSNLRVKIAVFMFIFTFFYSWGQGPIAFAYSSEVFPLINREAGMSFAVFINFLGAGILTLFVPLAQTNDDTLSHDYNLAQARLLGIFVGFSVLAFTLIFFFVPETAGATIRKRETEDHLSYMKLEELNYIFGVKTRKHVSYQIRHMIPYAGRMIRWWLCRWFTTRDLEPPKPKKMWIWVEMRDDLKQRDTSEIMLSSGSDLQGRWNKEARVSQASQRMVDQDIHK